MTAKRLYFAMCVCAMLLKNNSLSINVDKNVRLLDLGTHIITRLLLQKLFSTTKLLLIFHFLLFKELVN